MATASATRPVAPPPARQPASYDRLFCGGMATAMGLTVFTGFVPTYYLRFFGGGPMATQSGGSFTPLVQVHGALFTAWVLLFIVQTDLVASRHAAVHRRLGAAGAVLAAAMLGPFAFFGLALLFVVVAGTTDFLSRRRVHKVYVLGGSVDRGLCAGAVGHRGHWRLLILADC